MLDMKPFPILSVTRADVADYYENLWAAVPDRRQKAEALAAKLTDHEMLTIAGSMGEDVMVSLDFTEALRKALDEIDATNTPT